jgi:hypothetical protein
MTPCPCLPCGHAARPAALHVLLPLWLDCFRQGPRPLLSTWPPSYLCYPIPHIPMASRSVSASVPSTASRAMPHQRNVPLPQNAASRADSAKWTT